MAAGLSPSLPIRSSVALPPPGLKARVLGPADAAAYDAHMQRLSPQDRSLRFCGGMRTDGQPLARDADAILLGVFVDEALCGVAEMHLLGGREPDAAELAFSVDSSLQGRGIGRFLFGRIIQLAKDARLAKLVFICEPRNAPIIHLGQDHGARVVYEDGEVTGTIDLARSLKTAAPDEGPATAGLPAAVTAHGLAGHVHLA